MRPCLARASARGVFAAAAVTLAALSVGAEGIDWKGSLEKPASPGTMAILVGHGDEPEVQARWTTGLQNRAPEVRAAAARAIYASGTTAPVPTLVGPWRAKRRRRPPTKRSARSSPSERRRTTPP